MLIEGPFILNMTSSDGSRLQELCMENIVIDSQVRIFLFNAFQILFSPATFRCVFIELNNLIYLKLSQTRPFLLKSHNFNS